MTTVATQLPIRFVIARPMPTNQSIGRIKTRPTTGIAGIAFKVAARITIADPGIPCAPYEVISETKRTKARSCKDKGVLVACAIKTTARVR